MKSALSTRELMRLVVLAAINLALFQGAWFIVVIPPITMVAAILNVTLYWTWVRRWRISRALFGAIVTGLAMTLAFVFYMGSTRLNPTLTEKLLGWLPDSARQVLPVSFLGSRQVDLVDFALLDVFGFGSMIAVWRFLSTRDRSRKQRSVQSIERSS